MFLDRLSGGSKTIENASNAAAVVGKKPGLSGLAAVGALLSALLSESSGIDRPFSLP